MMTVVSVGLPESFCSVVFAASEAPGFAQL